MDMLSNQIARLVFIGGVSCALFGCHHQQQQDKIVAPLTIDQQLQQTAEAINISLEELAALEKAQHPQLKLSQPINAQRLDLAQKFTLDWVGPITPLIKQIGNHTRYHVKIIGREPAVPIIVSLKVKNQPTADILRNLNLQCGKRAQLITYPVSKIIELRYADN